MRGNNRWAYRGDQSKLNRERSCKERSCRRGHKQSTDEKRARLTTKKGTGIWQHNRKHSHVYIMQIQVSALSEQ